MTSATAEFLGVSRHDEADGKKSAIHTLADHLASPPELGIPSRVSRSGVVYNNFAAFEGSCFGYVPVPLVTSEAVLTELFHLVSDSRHEMEAAWKFLRSSAIALAAIGDSELPEMHALMSRYSDRPMDFTDATLVYLANREALSTILTVDHTDFETYRIEGRRRFRVLPANRPQKYAERSRFQSLTFLSKWKTKHPDKGPDQE